MRAAGPMATPSLPFGLVSISDGGSGIIGDMSLLGP